MQARLEVSLGGLGQDQLIERQVRHRPTQAIVLGTYSTLMLADLTTALHLLISLVM